MGGMCRSRRKSKGNAARAGKTRARLLDCGTRLLVVGLVAALAGGCDRQVGSPPTIVSAVPDIGHNAEPTPITIYGKNIFVRYDVDLQSSHGAGVDRGFSGHIGTAPLHDVRWVSTEQISAVVPARLRPGVYDISVATPTGDTAVLPRGFTVSDLPLLRVTDVHPAAAVTDGPTELTVSGMGFDPEAVLVLQSGAETVLTPTTATATTLTATLTKALTPGTYDVTVRNPDASEGTLPAGLALHGPAVLTATLSPLPTSVTLGETFALRLQISNEGGSTARSVTPVTPAPLAGAGSAELQGVPKDTSLDIAAGTDRQFEWTFLATGVGEINFITNATATNDVSGRPVTLANTDSAAIHVWLPQFLTASLTAEPAVVSVGQQITVTMTVQNHSTTKVNSVWPEELLANTPNAVRRTGAPSARVDLATGAQTDFVWTYLAVQDSTVLFRGAARGTDVGIRSQVGSNQAATNEVSIKAGSFLQVRSITVSPDPVSAGQQVTLTYQIDNVGDVDAHDVFPQTAAALGATAHAVGEPSPPSATIAAGATRSFSWSYLTTSTGALSFSGGAQGISALSRAEVIASAVQSNAVTVRAPAELSATLAAGPAVLSEGQAIAITMTVRNTGATTAKNVAPSPLSRSRVSTGGMLTGPIPASVDTLNAGAAQDFRWTYVSTAADAGALSFSGKATGRDVLSDAALESPVAASPTMVIQTPPSLKLTVHAPATTARLQEGVIVRVTVENSGQATANVAIPEDAALQLMGDMAGYVLTRTDRVTSVPGGESHALTFAVNVLATAMLGERTVDAQVRATDANSGDDVSVLFADPSTTTDSWIVDVLRTNAELALSLEIVAPSGARDGTLSTGQTFDIAATVQNMGTCAVDDSGVVTFALGTTGATAQGNLTQSFAVGVPVVLTLAAPATATAMTDLQVSISTAPTDDCTGAPAAISLGAATASIETVAAARLSIDATITGPAGATDGVLSTDQNFFVFVLVRNSGTAGVTGNAEITMDRGATGAVLLSPASLTVPFLPETPVVFTWQAPAIATAASDLTASVSAVPLDANTGEPAALTRSNDAVQLTTEVAAQVSASLASADPVQDGEFFVVIMFFGNTGQASATVTPQNAVMTVTGSAAADYSLGPTYATDVVEGSDAEGIIFTWFYSIPVGEAGSLTFAATAEWVDENATDHTNSVACSRTITVTNIRTWYQDLDGDGLGNNAVSLDQVTQPDGYVLDKDDCDDGLAECTADCETNTDGDDPVVIDCVERACGSDPNDPDDSCMEADGSAGRTLSDIIAAANARPGRDHILLAYSPTYASDANVVISSSDDGCVDLRGRPGTVITVAKDPGFYVKDGGCLFQDLVVTGGPPQVQGPSRLVKLDGAGNVIERCELSNFEKTAVEIKDADCQVVGSFIYGAWGAPGDGKAALHVNGAVDNVLIADNVIVDNTVDGIQLAGGPSHTVIDHNTIANNGGDAIEARGGGGPTNLCIRNNIMTGNAGAVLNARDDMTFDEVSEATTVCTEPLDGAPGASIYSNVVHNNTRGTYIGKCPSDTCPADGTFIVYDAVDPVFDVSYCAGASALIDAAADLGYDLNGDALHRFEGSAPDIGAQENGIGQCAN